MWLVELAAAVVGWFVDLLPYGPQPPEAITTGSALLGEVIQQSNQLCMWVDFPGAILAFGIAATAWGFGLMIRVARIVFGLAIG